MVFEKARGLGGRISRRRNEWGQFSHGSPSLGCATDTFAPQVRDWCDRGLIKQCKEPAFELSDGRLTPMRHLTPRYTGIPGSSSICRDLAETIEVQVSTRVERIEGSPRKWSVLLEGGEAFVGFGAVIVAAPAPQATELLARWPKLASPLSKVRMEPCHSLMLSFESALGLDFESARVKGSPLVSATRMSKEDTTRGGENWVLQTSPEWSAEHLGTSSHTVSRLLMYNSGDSPGHMNRSGSPICGPLISDWGHAATGPMEQRWKMRSTAVSSLVVTCCGARTKRVGGRLGAL
jgi:predicted NAD/FAD-dependent oxidoreductase